MTGLGCLLLLAAAFVGGRGSPLYTYLARGLVIGLGCLLLFALWFVGGFPSRLHTYSALGSAGGSVLLGIAMFFARRRDLVIGFAIVVAAIYLPVLFFKIGLHWSGLLFDVPYVLIIPFAAATARLRPPRSLEARVTSGGA